LDELRAEYRDRQTKIIRRLFAIAENGSDTDSLKAQSLINDRLYGRPRDTVAVELEDRRADDQTRAELEAWLANHLPDE
jgi:hypothetical protein